MHLNGTINITPLDVSALMTSLYVKGLPDSCGISGWESEPLFDRAKVVEEITSGNGRFVLARDTLIADVHSVNKTVFGHVKTEDQARAYMAQMQQWDPDVRLVSLQDARDHCRSILFSGGLEKPFVEALPYRHHDFCFSTKENPAYQIAGFSKMHGTCNEDSMAYSIGIDGARYYVACDGVGGHLGGHFISSVVSMVVSQKMAEGLSFATAINVAINVAQRLWEHFSLEIVAKDLVSKKLEDALLFATHHNLQNVINDEIEPFVKRYFMDDNVVRAVCNEIYQQASSSNDPSSLIDRLEAIILQKLKALNLDPLTSFKRMPATTIAVLKQWETPQGRSAKYYSIGDSRVLFYSRNRGSDDTYRLFFENETHSHLLQSETCFLEMALLAGHGKDDPDKWARLFRRTHPDSRYIYEQVRLDATSIDYFVSGEITLDPMSEHVIIVSSDRLTDNLDAATEIPQIFDSADSAEQIVKNLLHELDDKKVRHFARYKYVMKKLKELAEITNELESLDSLKGLLSAEKKERQKHLVEQAKAIWTAVGSYLQPKSLTWIKDKPQYMSGPFYITIDGVSCDDTTMFVVKD